MSEFDDLIEKLYPEDGIYLENIWKTFEMIHPRKGCYKFKSVKDAVNNKNKSRLIRPIRLGFFLMLRMMKKYRKNLDKPLIEELMLLMT